MPDKSCPACQSLVPDTAAYCGECGSRLESLVKVQDLPVAPSQALAENAPNPAKFAWFSGVSSSGRVNRTKLALVALGAVTVAGVGVAWSLGSDPAPTAAQSTMEGAPPDGFSSTPEPQAATSTPPPDSSPTPTAEQSASEEATPTPDATSSDLTLVVDSELPDFAGSGWNSAALDRAYCHGEGQFVALSDTRNFRGVVCAIGGFYQYRGLDKQNGLTLTTAAGRSATGYVGMGEGATYEIGPDTFVILAGTDVLAREEVSTWVTPEDDPFVPGELGLTKSISFPMCDGTGVVILANSFGPESATVDIQSSLNSHPAAEYLRTDLSCDGFNRPSQSRSGGEYIYASYLPGGSDTEELCRLAESEGGYAVWLQNDVDPAEARVSCS